MRKRKFAFIAPSSSSSVGGSVPKSARMERLKKKMSTPSSSGSNAKKEELCDCQLPIRICTSKTKDNPNKKFKVCPNSLKLGKKCKYWEQIDEAVTGNPDLEQELEAVKEDVACLKKKFQELKNKAHSYKVEISCNII
ncbi:hypothetical protein Lser_V15G17054 [Lactuca serriola]